MVGWNAIKNARGRSRDLPQRYGYFWKAMLGDSKLASEFSEANLGDPKSGRDLKERMGMKKSLAKLPVEVSVGKRSHKAYRLYHLV